MNGLYGDRMGWEYFFDFNFLSMEEKTELNERVVLNAHNKEEYPPKHSAEHLLNGMMVRKYGCGRAFSGHVERKKTKLDYRLDKPLSAEEIKGIEDYMNGVIREDVEVTEEFVRLDEVGSRFDMSRLPENASEFVRVVRIGDYDECLCAGLHVRSTSEIGVFRISSTRWQDGVQRIVFKLS